MGGAGADEFHSLPMVGNVLLGLVYPGVRAGLLQATDDAYSLLSEALRRNANDQPARIRLIEMIVGDVEFSGHHLPQYYIGSPTDDLARIAEAVDLLSGVDDPAKATSLRSELTFSSELIADWMSFTDADAPDFNEWCVTRGRTYRWTKACAPYRIFACKWMSEMCPRLLTEPGERRPSRSPVTVNRRTICRYRRP